MVGERGQMEQEDGAAAEGGAGQGASSGTKKSPSAFRTISEVSEELGVPQHVLRFWETKFSQVKPLKRGGGRRYYRPEDLALLRRIKGLLYDDGYTIRGVQKLLRDNGIKAVLAGDDTPLERGARHSGNGADTQAPSDSLSEDSRARLRSVALELGSLRDMLRKAR